MASNQLNPSKSEFVWCTSPRCTQLGDRVELVLPLGSINVSSLLENLEINFGE